VVETTETFGPITANYRHSYGGAETKELHKQLEEYVQNTYLAEKLNKYEHGKAEEKSKPFFIRLEAEKAKRGNVDENEAVVATPMGAIFERLPQSLREDDGEPSESDAKTPNNKYKIRKQDLVLPTPFVTEWHYRIVPSQGYKLRALPKDETVFFGPAKLTREYSQNADNTVQAVFRFDTMKRRWSADEVESARKAIRELGKKDVPLIYFDQAGHVALQAGKVREALDIYANLSSLHPTEALHHSQAARAYLVAGLGESAREEAERAVKLEPTSAKAYKTLGWILEHDLVGRRLQKGFDLKGAVAAFRKAKQLDPDDITIPTDLAILLEYDSEGIRYSQKADLNGAIAEYAGMKDKLEKAGVIDNPLWTLAWAGRFKELKEKTDSLPSSPTRVAFSLVATAALEGSASALKEATRITADDKARSTALIGAADQLLRIRKYQEAADLMAAGAQGSEQAASQVARAELLRKTKHYEDALYPESDPRRAVQLYLVKTFHGAPGTEVAGLLSHFSYSENAKKKAKAIKDLGEASRVIHNQLLQTGSSMDTLTDIVTSLMQFSSEGDDKTGYRLRGQSPGAPTQTFYVVKENDGYKLLGITPDDSQAVGSYILWKLIDSDVDASRRWLDWIREVEKRGGGDDAFSGKAFPHFWTKGQQADKDKIRYAAAALTSAGEDPELAVPVLLEGRSKATTDTERRDFDFALAQAYQTLRKYEELLIVSRRMAEGDKSSVRAFDFQCNALRGLKKFSEAEQLAEMRLKEIPDDLDAIHSIMRTAVFAGQPKKTVELAHGIIASGKAVAGDFNEESWFALVAESDIAAAIETARKGVSMTQNKSAGILHTLAALYAEHGDTKESREVILQTMTAWALDEPNSQSWYVFGRIAEQYGASEAAAKAYKRVEAPEVDEAIPGSTYQLAQRRLAFLNKKDTAGQD
jgi:tetratricopeptide (TPR) repeat protein